MTGFNSKRDAAADKLDNDDLTIAYMSGYHDGNRAAQPAQEPVAWTTMPESEDWCFVSGNKDPNGKLDGKWFPLYTTPPQRTWVGLTDEDIGQWIEEEHDVLRWAEAKLKEKNT